MLSVDLMDFSPAIDLPYTPDYCIYLISSFALEIENILFLQKKYKNTIVIPMAEDYDYYEYCVLLLHKIYYAVTYEVNIPAFVSFLLKISDVYIRDFYYTTTNRKTIDELNDVLVKYLGQQPVSYKEACAAYGYLVLNKTATRSIPKDHNTARKITLQAIKKLSEDKKHIVDLYNKKMYNVDVEKEYDINREVVIEEVEEQPDSHNQEQYLLPQFLKGKKRSRIL